MRLRGNNANSRKALLRAVRSGAKFRISRACNTTRPASDRPQSDQIWQWGLLAQGQPFRFPCLPHIFVRRTQWDSWERERAWEEARRTRQLRTSLQKRFLQPRGACLNSVSVSGACAPPPSPAPSAAPRRQDCAPQPMASLVCACLTVHGEQTMWEITIWGLNVFESHRKTYEMRVRWPRSASTAPSQDGGPEGVAVRAQVRVRVREAWGARGAAARRTAQPTAARSDRVHPSGSRPRAAAAAGGLRPHSTHTALISLRFQASFPPAVLAGLLFSVLLTPAIAWPMIDLWRLRVRAS